MIYIVEAALNKGHTDSEWNEFYSEMKPPSLLLSVDGLNSAQRFKGCGALASYLAIYGVESAEVMSSPSYKKVGGGNFRTERWKPMLSLWTRNLYGGADEAPEVPPDHLLLVLDCNEPHWLLDNPVLWLKSEGLDRTAPFRGLAIVAPAKMKHLLPTHPSVRSYLPLTVRATKANT